MPFAGFPFSRKPERFAEALKASDYQQKLIYMDGFELWASAKASNAYHIHSLGCKILKILGVPCFVKNIIIHIQHNVPYFADLEHPTQLYFHNTLLVHPNQVVSNLASS